MVRLISACEQVASQLRKAILDGQWSGEMPGIYVLAAELGVNHKTVDAALRQLEADGLLVAQGPGRRRRIVLPAGRLRQRPLRVGILPSVGEDRRLDYIVELRHELVEAGHVAYFPEKSLHEMGMDVKRIARMVRKNEADAWVVMAGPSEVLEWFVGQEIPAFALFGRRRHLILAGAGPDKIAAYREVVRHLTALGHRRIVLLALAARRLPEPGLPETAFLEELAAHGIPTGLFNLPDWEESPEGLQHLLDSLFKTSPPTAVLVDEAHLFHAVKHHLSGKGIRIPNDVSLVCTDPDRTFDWCRPSIAHIRWDSGPVVRRIVRWAENVAHGKDDRRQTLTPAKFVEGGTVGRVSSE
jgi:DNA-binding LacI/PurR family transcriptional regulator/biotin operon repressor